jgi:hypothetical protein
MADEIDRRRWLDGALHAVGRSRSGDLEEVRTRPWGAVWRAATDGGAVFLKEPAPATAFEVGLYGVLVRVAPDRVLHPLASDVSTSRLLLPDGGPVLGEQHRGADLLERLPEVARQYGQMQVDLAPHVDDLLELGVADMRPARMLDRFDEAVAGARPTSAEQADGLARITGLRGRIAEWCERLAGAPGPVSLDHNDLHGGNVFVDASGGARFFDWGDAVVSHAFASALVLRSVVRWLQDVNGETPAERQIIEAYLEPFGSFGSGPELRRALELACEVGKVARSLVWARAVAPMPPDVDDPDDFRGAPVGWLLELLEGPIAEGVQGSPG